MLTLDLIQGHFQSLTFLLAMLTTWLRHGNVHLVVTVGAGIRLHKDVTLCSWDRFNFLGVSPCSRHFRFTVKEMGRLWNQHFFYNFASKSRKLRRLVSQCLFHSVQRFHQCDLVQAQTALTNNPFIHLHASEG